MSDQALEGLKNVPYFHDVPEGALQRLAASAFVQGYPKGTVLISEGDAAGALYVILSGKVQAYLRNKSGRTVTLAVQEPGSFFGELSLLDGGPRSASVVTLEPTECLLVPREPFLDWLRQHPDAAISIIHCLTRRVRLLTENVRGLALSDVYGRLVKTLLSMAVQQDQGWVIDRRPTHQELSNLVGCSREMVSRIMRDLVRGDYVAIDGKALRIQRKLPPSW